MTRAFCDWSVFDRLCFLVLLYLWLFLTTDVWNNYFMGSRRGDGDLLGESSIRTISSPLYFCFFRNGEFIIVPYECLLSVTEAVPSNLLYSLSQLQIDKEIKQQTFITSGKTKRSWVSFWKGVWVRKKSWNELCTNIRISWLISANCQNSRCSKSRCA